MQRCEFESNVKEMSGESWIMAMYRTGVEFGTWNGNFPWGNKHREEDLLELHIFNKEKECRSVYSERKKDFIREVIKDKNTQKIESKMLLLGEEFVTSGKGFYLVRESGREKKIYLDKTREEFEKGIYIKVVDYFDFDENMLMYHSGYRMTGIE